MIILNKFNFHEYKLVKDEFPAYNQVLFGIEHIETKNKIYDVNLYAKLRDFQDDNKR